MACVEQGGSDEEKADPPEDRPDDPQGPFSFLAFPGFPEPQSRGPFSLLETRSPDRGGKTRPLRVAKPSGTRP